MSDFARHHLFDAHVWFYEHSLILVTGLLQLGNQELGLVPQAAIPIVPVLSQRGRRRGPLPLTRKFHLKQLLVVKHRRLQLSFLTILLA